MKLGLHQSARLEQRLVQSPQMIQAMQILQLSGLDLLDRIQAELVENPFLEVEETKEEKDGEPTAESPEGAAPEGGDAPEGAVAPESGENAPDPPPPPEPEPETERDELVEVLERLERDSLDGFTRRTSDGEEGDRKLEAMANTPMGDKSLAEALLEELAFLDLNARTHIIAEYIVWSLDDRGYLTQSLEEIAAEVEAEERSTGAEHGEAAVESPPPSDEGNGTVVGRAPFPTAAVDSVSADPRSTTARPIELDADDAEPADADAGSAEPARVHADSAQMADAQPEGELAADTTATPSAPGTVTAAEVAAVLEQIRALSHPALGARDLKESLMLQIAAHGMTENTLLVAIVENHLEDLEQNRLPRISKSTGHSIEAVKHAVSTLKTLDPHPGAGYGETKVQTITPDVIVEEIDGEYEVRLERQRIPQLSLSPAYREFLKNAKKGDGVREWVKQRVEAARWFIEAIHQRQSTLQRIAQAIFVRQRGFLERGVEGFQPLRMQEVADEVHVHISTVSRAVAGKYAQTPRGIYPLKYFFAGGTQKATGEVASQVSIKQRIADLVGGEDPDKPLSDDELAKMLEDKDGVRIARRTVTKYRKALSIPSSNQRRRF